MNDDHELESVMGNFCFGGSVLWDIYYPGIWDSTGTDKDRVLYGLWIEGPGEAFDRQWEIVDFDPVGFKVKSHISPHMNYNDVMGYICDRGERWE